MSDSLLGYKVEASLPTCSIEACAVPLNIHVYLKNYLVSEQPPYILVAQRLPSSTLIAWLLIA